MWGHYKQRNCARHVRFRNWRIPARDETTCQRNDEDSDNVRYNPWSPVTRLLVFLLLTLQNKLGTTHWTLRVATLLHRVASPGFLTYTCSRDCWLDHQCLIHVLLTLFRVNYLLVGFRRSLSKP